MAIPLATPASSLSSIDFGTAFRVMHSGERRCHCPFQETAGLGMRCSFWVGGERDASVRRAFAMPRRWNAGSR